MWEQIKQIYKEKYNVDPEIVELLAVMDILNAFVSGMSNKSIANCFDIDENYIDDVLIEYLNQIGWPYDLDKNPLRVYNLSMDEKDFEVKGNFGKMVYDAVKKYKEYERKLNDEYYRFA